MFGLRRAPKRVINLGHEGRRIEKTTCGHEVGWKEFSGRTEWQIRIERVGECWIPPRAGREIVWNPFVAVSFSCYEKKVFTDFDAVSAPRTFTYLSLIHI